MESGYDGSLGYGVREVSRAELQTGSTVQQQFCIMYYYYIILAGRTDSDEC